jgi:diadenosine tetraphosphate (Ap4A) HIT family hydrolase
LFTEEIARAILFHDQSQIEYYQGIMWDMVGRVLTKRGLVYKDKQSYTLAGYEGLTQAQIQTLMEICEDKLEQYTSQRGKSIWQHRRQYSGYISGTLRYEVLKRAAFHCELGGIFADLKALEVDHITPRNKGGSDEMENLQALCYSFNAMKRDRDGTNFRHARDSYTHRELGCLLCEFPKEKIIVKNNLAYAIRDGFPVTSLHILVIPKRHVLDYFSLIRPELNACDQLLKAVRAHILVSNGSVTGFNIGMNAGKDTGQALFYCHIRIIPSRQGDVENPRGGARHLIPGKDDYQA